MQISTHKLKESNSAPKDMPVSCAQAGLVEVMEQHLRILQCCSAGPQYITTDPAKPVLPLNLKPIIIIIAGLQHHLVADPAELGRRNGPHDAGGDRRLHIRDPVRGGMPSALQYTAICRRFPENSTLSSTLARGCTFQVMALCLCLEFKHLLLTLERPARRSRRTCGTCSASPRRSWR